jgi:hypothetical protein
MQHTHMFCMFRLCLSEVDMFMTQIITQCDCSVGSKKLAKSWEDAKTRVDSTTLEIAKAPEVAKMRVDARTLEETTKMRKSRKDTRRHEWTWRRAEMRGRTKPRRRNEDATKMWRRDEDLKTGWRREDARILVAFSRNEGVRGQRALRRLLLQSHRE